MLPYQIVDFQIDDSSLIEIAEHLPYLQELNVKDSSITSQGVMALTRCSHLQILNFEYCQAIDDAGVTFLLQSIGR